MKYSNARNKGGSNGVTVCLCCEYCFKSGPAK